MIPLTRKENYLNEIVGWGNTAPEKPTTPEEFFFAAILGEAVQVPDLSNASRYELFLAKIAGYNVNISPPTYTSPRLEFFLAKACGMDIETPTPITREEIFWSNYTAIVELEVEGVPPLTYKAIEGTLENYRIYGNTVGGAGVGDLVESGEHAGEYKVPVTVEGKNLFDGELAQGYYSDVAGSSNDLISFDKRVAGTSFIPVSAGSTMALTYESTIGITKHLIYYYNNNKELINAEGWYINGSTFTIPNNVSFIRIVWGAKVSGNYVTLSVANISNIMLNAGSTPLPYEPYHTPVTTPIYLPEPIKMVGDEAEYIDYGEQKQHRVRKNLLENTATSQTVNGVTFTVNDDGSVTCNTDENGATNTAFFVINENINYSGYLLSGCPQNGGVNSYILRYQKIGAGYVEDYGNGVTLPEYGGGYIVIRINAGCTCNNLTFYPMIRKVDIEDDTYEPYIENTDLDVTLPALPTLPGTNVLSVGTAVQPSEVYVKYKGERQ